MRFQHRWIAVAWLLSWALLISVCLVCLIAALMRCEVATSFFPVVTAAPPEDGATWEHLDVVSAPPLLRPRALDLSSATMSYGLYSRGHRLATVTIRPGEKELWGQSATLELTEVDCPSVCHTSTTLRPDAGPLK